MKRFDEIYQSEPNDPEFLEERLLRKGAGVMFASQSRTRGNKAERHFNNAITILTNNGLGSDAEPLETLGKALVELSMGLVETRHQIGALTSLALIGVVLSERKSKR
jgi:hypothetical protein